MAKFGTIAARTGLTEGWRFLIRTASGTDPHIERKADRVVITMSPRQQKELATYLGELFSVNPFAKEKPFDPDAANVSINLGNTLMQLAIKKFAIYLLLYGAAFYALGRFTK